MSQERGTIFGLARPTHRYEPTPEGANGPLRGPVAADERPRARPLVVFLGKAQLGDDRSPTFRRRLGILQRHLRPVLVKTGASSLMRRDGLVDVTMPVIRPRLLGGLVFYVLGPVLALILALTRRPSAVVCQSPLEGVGVIALGRLIPRGWRPAVQIEVHGDWRTAPRLYGSRLRRVLAPMSDRLSAWSVRHADRIRVVSNATAERAESTGYRGPLDRYVEFSDLSRFVDDPPIALPEGRRAVFVGALERYKGIDVLISAWPKVVASIPDAQLSVVGRGTLEGMLKRHITRGGLGGSITLLGHIDPETLRTVFDHSWCLVLPSRSEGLGRVVFEAMARARPVVASAVGGLLEIIDDGSTGYLVDPDQADHLATALLRVLSDPDQAAAMGLEGRRHVLARDPLAEFDSGIERLAAWVRDRVP